MLSSIFLADLLTTNSYKPSPLSCRPPHDYDGLFLVQQCQQVHNIKELINYTVHGIEYMIYMCNCNNWSKTNFAPIISWKSYSKSITSLQGIHCLNMLQLLHDWQNTGTQKETFYNSSVLNSNTSVPLDTPLSISLTFFQCPMCRIVQGRTPFHFVFYSHSQSILH